MDSIRNQTHRQARRLENAPEDVVVPVQFARTAVSQMREALRAGLDRLPQCLRRSVGVTQTDLDAERCGQLDGFQRAWPFRRNREQYRIIAGDGSQFPDVIRRRVYHSRWVVRSVK